MRDPKLIERLARSFAVAYVDGRHGYTMEFAPSPPAHRDEYDEAESYARLVLETEFRFEPALSALPAQPVTFGPGDDSDPALTALKYIAEDGSLPDKTRRDARVAAAEINRLQKIMLGQSYIERVLVTDEMVGRALAADKQAAMLFASSPRSRMRAALEAALVGIR